MTITDENRLRLAELPEPSPQEGEVLVDVVAAGVNRADLAQVAGGYPPPPGASELPGLEISGRRRDTGEEVVALLAGGGYAEVVAVPEELLLPAPAEVDLVDAAGVVEAAATVVSNLLIEARMTAGETLLVHGASGGIGSFAIQLAHRLGVRVLAVVGSEPAARAVRELGADEVLNRREDELLPTVRDLGGADVVLDLVGGPILSSNVRLLRENGRLVVIGLLGGSRGELPLGELMGKRARVIGTTLRSRPVADKHEILTRTREVVWPMLADGRIRVPVQARYDLAESAEAHDVLRQGGHLGKVVLQVADA